LGLIQEDSNNREIGLTKEGLALIRKEAKSNVVLTSKYSLLSFLPLNLYEQFKKVANIYFLLISFLQTIPSISDSGGRPTMLAPLIFVVLVAMIKDAFEDYKRHAEDAKENNATAMRFEGNSFKQCRWADIQVGDFV